MDNASRVFWLMCVLVGVWVVTYWLWEPRRPASLEPVPALASQTPMPKPEPRPEPKADIVRAPMPGPKSEPARPVDPPVVLNRQVQKVEQPQFREVVVKPGDTFAEVARRELGDRSKWPIIARANPLVSPDRLKPGVTKLRIPLDPDNIQGKVVTVNEPDPSASGKKDPASGPGSGGGDQPQSAPPAPKPEARTYVIKADDTLWGIAKTVYGRGALWKELYEANRDVIKDPDRPPAGATIRVPAVADLPPAGR